MSLETGRNSLKKKKVICWSEGANFQVFIMLLSSRALIDGIVTTTSDTVVYT